MTIQKITGAIAVYFFITLLAGTADAETASQTEIIFDASGSMNEMRGSAVKLDMAKEAMRTIAGKIPEGSQVGLRVFGTTPIQGNIKESCEDSKLAIPIGVFRSSDMIQSIDPLESYGMTALGYSLELAGKDFSAAAGTRRNIILISDGEETCGKDPVAVMEALKAQGIEIAIHAIGFAASDAAKAQLKKLSEMTGGTYHEAEDAASLEASLTESVQQTLLLKPGNDSTRENILSAAGGARIVSSDSELFANLIDGSEERIGAFSYGNQAIFSFKDNQPVLLEKFLAPVFQVAGSNMGEIKLYGSVESPESGFFKIVDAHLQNTVAFGNVYQEFKINPPRPIRYLKAVLGKSVEGSAISVIYAEEWKAEGKYLTEDEFKAELAKLPAPEMNLLAKENGGEVIAGARADYADLITAKSDIFRGTVNVNIGDEVIFGFKSGGSVMLTKIGIPILEASPNNLKGVEISVSDISPGGPFTAAGTFETTNLVFPKNLVQEYTFEHPVKAKYLKIKFLSNHGGNACYAYQILAMGFLENRVGG